MLCLLRRLLRRLLVPAPLLLLVLLLAACGGGGQDRPLLVSTYPPSGSRLTTGLSEMRLDFDEPVELFLAQALELRVDGQLQGVLLYQDPVEVNSVHFRPLDGESFHAGFYEVLVLPGLVLDRDRHYALEDQVFTFELDDPSTTLVVPASTR